MKRSNFKGFGWRSRWDSNPRAFWANGFQDRLVMTASIQLRISILFLFSSTFARKTCKKCKKHNYRKVCKPLCYKGLRWMSRSVIWNISRPPRYDHFDTAPYAVQVYQTAISIQKSVRNFNQELKLTCPGHRNLYIRSRSCPYRRFCRSA